MKTIVIKTQAELDALPEKFEEFTRIEIRSEKNTTIIISKNPENSRAELRENSRAVLWENTRAVLWENSRAELWGNTRAVLWENTRAVLWGNSSAELLGNSRAVLWENSSAVLWENTRAVLWENTRAELWGNSRAELWGNSRAELRGDSSALASEASGVVNYSSRTSITLYDNTTAILHQDPDMIAIFDKAHITKREDIITPTFGDWLERGWVVADGIRQKLVSSKTQGEVTIYTTQDFLSKETFYVAQKGDKFAHAKSVAEAVKDLRYKITDRDSSEFKHWKLGDVKTLDELIEAYRVITGACAEGTKMFCEGRELKDKYTIQEAIELTANSYGHQQFAGFFLRGKENEDN